MPTTPRARPRTGPTKPISVAPRSRRSATLAQTALIACAAIAYFGVRHLTQGSEEAAFAHARAIMDLERDLGIAIERHLQSPVAHREWLRTGTNWIYIWGHWPVIIVALTWLHLTRPSAFRTLRNAIFISGAIGIVIFAAYPVAPPRFADAAAIDTVSLHSSSYRALQPPGLVNPYAAMPSLHFGWNLLVGIMLVRVSRRRLVRVVGILLPIAMAYAVMATANHYLLDVPAGGVVALVGLALVPLVSVLARVGRRHLHR